MRARFRVVRDRYSGFEVQKKVWWWPWWFQPRTNTRRTLEEAEELAVAFSVERRVVKDLGRLPSDRTAPRVAP